MFPGLSEVKVMGFVVLKNSIAERKNNGVLRLEYRPFVACFPLALTDWKHCDGFLLYQGMRIADKIAGKSGLNHLHGKVKGSQ